MAATDAPRMRAVLTVTIDAEGDYYADHADLLAHVVPWIEGTLEDRDDIRNVTITEQTAPADRAAILREAADELEAPYEPESGYDRGRAWVIDELRRLADEAQQPETQAEDPARIDRLRPEFTEHSSVESIDAQLQRARSQQRRWHLRAEWLISLRQARVEQKARGEWPAAVSQSPAAEGEVTR